MTDRMLSVAAARERARGWVAAHSREAVLEPDALPSFGVSLRPPSEREVLADERAAEAWARDWRGAALPAGAIVIWEARTWSRIGRQEIPVRLEFADPEAVAAFGGGAAEREYGILRGRVATARAILGSGVDPVLRRSADTLRRMPDERFDSVLAVSAWLAAHPVDGLRPRQLPIRGVDSKWFGRNRALVSALVGAVSGRKDLGVVDSERLVRVRILDPQLSIQGMRDVTAPLAEWAVAPLAPRVAVVVENLETLLALPDRPGVVAVHGSGFAVDAVGLLPWLKRVPILYWGDLDSNGFAILHRLRSAHPRGSGFAPITSVLMDESTLLAHRDLWVPEPTPARGVYPTLTPGEQAALTRLRDEGHVRLEQERIPWAHALAALDSALHSVG